MNALNNPETIKALATAILKAQELHEASYVVGEPSTVDIGGEPMSFPTGHYTKDHMQCAVEACGFDANTLDPEDQTKNEFWKTSMVMPVYLLNASDWNDAQMWAEDVLGIERKEQNTDGED